MQENPRTIQISTNTILTTVFVLLALLFLYVVRDVILVLLIAVTLASALEPLVAWARAKLKLPRSLTVLLVYLVVIGTVGTFFYTLTPVFIEQFQELGIKYKEFTANLENGTGPLAELVQRTGTQGFIGSLFNSLTGLSAGGFGSAVGVFTGFLEIISILVISFYLVVEQGALRSTLGQMLPENHREKAIRVVTAIQRKLGLWLVGQIILSLAIFLMTWVVLSVLNVPLALALAAVAGLLEIVPFLGPFISAIPAVLIAFTISPTLAVIVGVMYLLIQKTEGYVLVPKIMQKTVGLNPLLVLIAILVGFKLAGIFGALLAVPVVAAASVLIEAYVVGKTPHVPDTADQILIARE